MPYKSPSNHFTDIVIVKVIASTGKGCGATKTVSTNDDSLQEWRNGHKCEEVASGSLADMLENVNMLTEGFRGMIARSERLIKQSGGLTMKAGA